MAKDRQPCQTYDVPFLNEQNVQDKYLEIFNLSSIISHLQKEDPIKWRANSPQKKIIQTDPCLTRWDSL